MDIRRVAIRITTRRNYLGSVAIRITTRRNYLRSVVIRITTQRNSELLLNDLTS